MTNRYDPDVRRKIRSVEQIARFYQGSHMSIANMPCDDEFLFALKANGHSEAELSAVKEEYCAVSRRLWDWP